MAMSKGILDIKAQIASKMQNHICGWDLIPADIQRAFLIGVDNNPKSVDETKFLAVHIIDGDWVIKTRGNSIMLESAVQKVIKTAFADGSTIFLRGVKMYEAEKLPVKLQSELANCISYLQRIAE